jgi:protein-disulfide isomerase
MTANQSYGAWYHVGVNPEGKPMSASIPLAIVAAGAMIALSIYLVWSPSGSSNSVPTEVEVPKITADDYVLGNPEAPVVIIEYSDLDCPFCKQFHVTMKQIMSTYGATGKVAWVYRHFPIAELHPNAPLLAETAECVGEEGGNAAFWKFIDNVFAEAPGNDQFPLDRMDLVIQKSGVTLSNVKACVAEGTHRARVEKQFADAIKAGGEGTPHNIVLTTAGRTIPVPGSQPYATLQSIIDTLLTE